MGKRVVVTGLGTVNPLGNSVNESWANMLAGKSGIARIREVEKFIDFPTTIAGEVKNFDPEKHGISAKDARRTARFILLALAAAKEAVADSGLEIEPIAEQVGVMIGSGVGGIDILEEQAKTLVERGIRRVSPFTCLLYTSPSPRD